MYLIVLLFDMVITFLKAFAILNTLVTTTSSFVTHAAVVVG